MEKDLLSEILQRYIEGRATPGERDAVERWYEKYAGESSVRDLSPQEREELLDGILRNVQPKKKAGRVWIAAAASIILCLSVTWFYVFKPKQQAATPTIVRSLRPGSDRATLTLANGKTLVLSSTDTGMITLENQVKAVNSSDGTLAYQQPADRRAPIAWNTLNTPYGGQYHLVLADGTQVWLNSGSSLYFPNRFESADRTVQLKGEAYFEVAKSKVPFFVKSGSQTVQVLGTHFNVKNYADDASVQTTLAEGSVKVTSGDMRLMLLPGEQSDFNPAEKILTKQKVDVGHELAWKDGLFWFRNEDIRSVMKEFSRWYNARIEYRGPDIKQKFSGTIPRTTSPQNFLKILSQTNAVQFSITADQKVIVSN